MYTLTLSLLVKRFENIKEYTPAIQQHIKIKYQNPDCILFFQLGDFYELLFEDADLVAKELEIALTSKSCGNGKKAKMAGVPIHSYEPHLYKLVEKGYKVAIVEQLQDPKDVKGVVKRGITRIISKGTINEGQSLEEKGNNYIVAINSNNSEYEITFADVSTGELNIAFYKSEEELRNFVFNIKPSEVVIKPNIKDKINILFGNFNTLISVHHPFVDNSQYILRKLPNYKEYKSLQLLFNYLEFTQKRELEHFSEVNLISKQKTMELDHFAIKNLELVENLHEKSQKGSLLWAIDRTITASGGRLLKRWIQNPSIDKNEIQVRLNSVEEVFKKPLILYDIQELLKNVYDLERILSKISFGTINPKDLKALNQSLSILPSIRQMLTQNFKTKYIKDILLQLSNLDDLSNLLEASLVDNPPISTREGGIFKKQFNNKLDKLKDLEVNGKEWLINFTNTEKEKHNIPTLKVKYSRSFGYFIEVSKKQSDLVPNYYNRLQTLVNSERYTTEELVKKADDILNADERIKNLEYTLFEEIKNQVKLKLLNIKSVSNGLSKLDVIVSLSDLAISENYIKPMIIESKENHLYVEKLRHPVAEKMIDTYIPNDIKFNNKEQIMLITGPNASGKSTFMKSVATSIILAQIGSFVPAEKFEFSIVDRVFTRIGATDDLFNHQSTFMMEMTEINQALKYATNKSLIVIDELGRGTSTDEGIAIAKSIIDYIHTHKTARSLIATHYHELTDLEKDFTLVKNYSMQVHEEKDDVVFLHKMKPGKAGKSYAIYCAKLCNLPKEVINKANSYLVKEVENTKSIESAQSTLVSNLSNEIQSIEVKDNLKEINNEYEDIISLIEKVDLLNTTPLEALSILNKLKNKTIE